MLVMKMILECIEPCSRKVYFISGAFLLKQFSDKINLERNVSNRIAGKDSLVLIDIFFVL